MIGHAGLSGGVNKRSLEFPALVHSIIRACQMATCQRVTLITANPWYCFMLSLPMLSLPAWPASECTLFLRRCGLQQGEREDEGKESFAELQIPCRVSDKATVGCATMVRIVQRAQLDRFSPWGRTALPSLIPPHPAGP